MPRIEVTLTMFGLAMTAPYRPKMMEKAIAWPLVAPLDAVANDRTPAPSVCMIWLAVPSAVGYFNPAGLFISRVTVPLAFSANNAMSPLAMLIASSPGARLAVNGTAAAVVVRYN